MADHATSERLREAAGSTPAASARVLKGADMGKTDGLLYRFGGGGAADSRPDGPGGIGAR